MPDAIQKLYHYTDINSLALILQSKSIRFGRLDKVNDPTEGLSLDFHSMAQYIFISSWTANQSENFALWNMYTPLMRGVRMELDLPIFDSFSIPKNGENNLVDGSQIVNYEKGYFIFAAENVPSKIIYTDDNTLLRPSIRKGNGIYAKALSKYKKLIWQIEEEYRYQLNIVPIDRNITPSQVAESYMRLLSQQLPLPIDSYMIGIQNRAFDSMRIKLSPKLLPGDRTIVEALVKAFNPSATIEDSLIHGFIR
jgi:hypothetical protein